MFDKYIIFFLCISSLQGNLLKTVFLVKKKNNTVILTYSLNKLISLIVSKFNVIICFRELRI